MGGSSIGYLLREGARNIYANKQMSVAAIGVLVACMLLIGASIVFSFNANSFVGYVEAQNEVVVFLKDNLSDDRISEVEQQLKNTENVSAVRFISKEEGLDSWVQSMSGVAENSEELFAPLYEDNIMPDSFSVTIRDLSQLDATVQVLSDYDDVDYVRAPEQVAQTITIIKHAVNLGGAAIVLLLIGVASMIIANTIKITVFNRRKEISIMKYVGATDMFIRLPFIVEGLLLGAPALHRRTDREGARRVPGRQGDRAPRVLDAGGRCRRRYWLHRVHRQGDRQRARRIRHCCGHRNQPGEPSGRAVPGQDRVLLGPRGLPLLHDVPHPPGLPGLGFGEPRSRQRGQSHHRGRRHRPRSQGGTGAHAARSPVIRPWRSSYMRGAVRVAD